MGKFKGALPLIYVRQRVKSNGDVVTEGCRRPLSRKKLKALLSQRPADTKAVNLMRSYGRQPGRGKLRRIVRKHYDRLEMMPEQMRSREDGALLGLLAGFFGRPGRRGDRGPGRKVAAK